MANTHASDKPGQRGRVKDVPDHAVRLALVQAALVTACDDAASVLAAMLEQAESFADLGRCDGFGVVQ